MLIEVPRLFPYRADPPRHHPISAVTSAAFGPFIRVISTDLSSSYLFPLNSYKTSNMGKNVTLFDGPGVDSTKAPIENVLELTPVVDIGPVRYAYLLTKYIKQNN